MSCLAIEIMPLAESLAQKRGQLWLKRTFDLLFAASVLVALAPAMLLIALLIRVTSRGPAFFRQIRVGREGGEFAIYKFRSMRVETSPGWAAAQSAAEARGELLKAKKDPRITRLGALLRRTSLDELPQLINVARGEMSLVGPRPLVPFMLAPFPGFAQARGLVRPGITGLWQVRHRHNNTSATDMMADDLEYIREFRLSLDFLILAKTMGVVLSRKGAV